MLDFPNTPTNGAIFTSPLGASWIYNQNRWTTTNAPANIWLPLAGGTLTGPLIINTNAATLPAPTVANAPLRVGAVDSTPTTIELFSAGAAGAGANYLLMHTSGGTIAAPTVSPNGMALGGWASYGWSGSAWVQGCQIIHGTTQAWSGTQQGSFMTFYTIGSGATTEAVRMRIDTGVTIGTQGYDPGQGCLVLNANVAALPAPIFPGNATQFYIGNVDGQVTRAEIASWGGNPGLIFRTARGTAAAPTAAQGGDPLGLIYAYGRGSASFQLTSGIQFMANQNLTDSAAGGYINFFTTTINTTTPTTRLQVQSGVLVMTSGGAVPTGGDMGAGTINAGSGYYINGSATGLYSTSSTTASLNLGGVTAIFNNGTYIIINDQSNNNAIFCGGSSDQENYYRNTNHRFQGVNGSGDFMAIGNPTTMRTHIWPLSNNAYYCGANGNAWYGCFSYGFTNQSDIREKTAIKDLPDCLDLVQAISPKQYKFTTGPEEDHDRNRWGFIAQDVSKIMREAGHDFGGHYIGDDEARSEALSYGDLTAVLWKAVQELAAEVRELKRA